MLRSTLGFAALTASLLVAGPSLAQTCTRDALQAAVDGYIAAQTAGDPKLMHMAVTHNYMENGHHAEIPGGVISTPQKIDFHRDLLDTDTCQTFSEVVITNPAHPMVIGTRLKVAPDGTIPEVESLVTTKGDWLFSAKNDLKYSPTLDYSIIPEGQRASRESLMAAANAYFDDFKDKSAKVPWGTPCRRLEGGMITGKGAPDDSCNVGVPSGVDIVDRRFVVDPDHGAVVGLVTFGTSGSPDAHMFRLEDGKIRWVFTITKCAKPNCGLPPLPPAVAAKLEQ